jgi:UDP-glucuronate decarboxylase
MGNDVLCVDNFFSGRKSNVAHLLTNPNFEILRHDITFPLFVEVDQIYNLACPASPIYYQRDPVQTIKTCVHGAINMLGLAKRTGARILQSSTSEIYGNPEVHPQVEDYWGNVNPLGIRSCYDEGKRCAESLFMSYFRQYRTEIKIARIFNTYGPRMLKDDGRVVSNFIVQALNGQEISLHGEGTQTRSFCYVDDLINALIALMESPVELRGPVNLGNPEELTIRDLAELVVRMTGSSSKIRTNLLPQDDPQRRKPDISLATSALGWRPSTPLGKGLEFTIDYFRKVLGIPSAGLQPPGRQFVAPGADNVETEVSH